MDKKARQTFERAIVRNLTYWLQFANNESEGQLSQRISREHANLHQAVQLGLKLVAATRIACDLFVKVHRIIGSRLRLETEWLGISEQLYQFSKSCDDETLYPVVALAHTHLLRQDGQQKACQSLLVSLLPEVLSDSLRVEILFELSESYRLSNEVENAIVSAELGKSLAINLETALFHAGLANTLGILKTHAGDYAEADLYFTEAFAFEEEHGDPTRILRVLISWADKYHRQQDLDSAMRQYEHAMTFLDESSNSVDVIQLLINLGALHFDRGQFEDAESLFYDVERRLSMGSGLYFLRAQNATNLGAVFQATNRHKEAVTVLEQGIMNLRRLDNMLCLCRTLLNYAESLLALARLDEAERACREAKDWLALNQNEPWPVDMLTESSGLLGAISQRRQSAEN